MVVFATGLLLASGEGRAQDAPELQFEVPKRLGGDANGDRIFDGSRTPDNALDDPLIDLRVNIPGAHCDPSAEYEWQVNGLPTQVEQLGKCRFSLRVVQGKHEVSATDSSDVSGSPVTGVVDAADHLIVSIGDSVASGEGNPDVGGYLLRGARWLDRQCHRSMLSGAARAALRAERGEETSRITFVPLGCSGASVPRGLLGGYRGIEPDRGTNLRPQVGQLNEIAADVDAVLINIGGNDVSFESIIRFCAGVRDCPNKRFDRGGFRESPDPDDPPLRAFVSDAVEQLSDRLDMLGDRISPAIADERVLLVEYFDPTQGPDGPCRMLGGLIDRNEAEWAHDEVLGPLNDTLREAAERHHWTFIDGVDEGFQGHGICAPSEKRWIRTPTRSFVTQGTFNPVNRLSGTLHPDGAGHAATATLIGNQLGPILGAEFSEDPIGILGQEDGLPGFAWLLIFILGGLLLLGTITLGLGLLRSRRARSDH